MQLPGADPTGPLGRGLDKLAAALGGDEVVVDLPIPPAVEQRISVIADAVRDVEVLRVEYWTPSRDEVTERTITPRRVFNDRGEWYVVADDGRSGQRRTFRIDRIESVVGTGERGEPVEPGDVAGTPEWFADGGLPQVTLRLAPAATWVVERYPVDEVVHGGRPPSSLAFRSRPSDGWSACCCDSAPRPRCSARRRGGRLAADVARRVLRVYE